MSFADRLAFCALASFGTVAAAGFAEFWFRERHVADPLGFAMLSIALWEGIGRMLLAWLAYAGLERAAFVPAPPGLSVAVFTTAAPGEPLEMFETTLRAIRRMRYPHTAYLLDGTGDPRFRALAERHGVVWLDSSGLPGAKAGKINAALRRTSEEFVLVLDPDHVPFPEFLDRVLGHFRDGVGFVQVSQAYYNQRSSAIAAAAAGQTYDFYGPIQMGLNGHGCAIAIGANCTFRRKALDSIGGHAVALAEDLVTSIRLHAAGWRSVYVPEILSRGLVPETLGAYYQQQLKWARGAFEMLFLDYPRAFDELTVRQRIAYAAIGTYYVVGLTTTVCVILPCVALLFGALPVRIDAGEFLSAGLPLAAAGIALHYYGQRWLCDPAGERGWHIGASVLKLSCWYTYLLAGALALLDRLVPYVPTRKQANAEPFWRIGWPHVLLASMAGAALAVFAWRQRQLPLSELWTPHDGTLVMMAFAVISLLCSLRVLAWPRSPRAPAAAKQGLQRHA